MRNLLFYPSPWQRRPLGATDGRVTCQQSSEAGYGGYGILPQAEDVSDYALVKLYARGVYGALVE